MCKTRQNPLRKPLPHRVVRLRVRDSMPFAIERIDEPARKACCLSVTFLFFSRRGEEGWSGGGLTFIDHDVGIVEEYAMVRIRVKMDVVVLDAREIQVIN